MFNGGYTGRILRINLTEQTSTVEPLPQDLAREYIGGAGFTTKIVYDSVKAGTDPLGPDNVLVLASGPFSGTKVPCASRMAVGALSPLTGAMALSLTGGHFPVELKFAGYDVLIIEGRSEEPVYLWIDNDSVKFRKAGQLWGMSTSDCQTTIRNQLHDNNVRVACIGPAGENLSRMACIINELRAAGRKGMGAVMGSKNLKAIAIRGTGKVQVADEEKFKAARSRMTQAMKRSEHLYPQFSKVGTSMVVDATSALGIFPANNYMTTGEVSLADDLGAEAFGKRTRGSQPCYGCPVGCSQVRVVTDGKHAGTLSEGPEFETMYSLGSTVGIHSADFVIAADRLCDELGIDTMSSGVTIGFAMELFQKGIITLEDTGGLDLTFGNEETVLELLHLMSYRQGFGKVLADGSRIAGKLIGKDSGKYAMHVKGLELPAYDVRGAKAHGLNYATSFTGADHCRGYAFQELFGIPVPKAVDRFASEGKGELTVWNQDVRTATTDLPTMCGFLLDMALPDIALQNTADLMEAVTGLVYTPEEVQKAGERVNNLARLFNIRQGFTRADDNLPDRLISEPLAHGGSKGQCISREELDMMLDEYYDVRGWDRTGIPTPAKLAELGLTVAKGA
ncbi:Aldehyde ferredoxin oxidoreductase [Pseudodesulfovibrio mercurii]|uniref:Aldehyde ferredoxin oxidoreductase n=2 Tax=Pseudodesulfovibrio mercurii TaxID=641491 RepID=F0JC25_9BACT|nr:aldehyde ferredoxin oxidoreductase family protein [Pseudodesulfovibrio mercurii]EGB15598.1 Aldehyde ferredoxin oxidoreductase [Pseudodesulfovibrio mercurii]